MAGLEEWSSSAEARARKGECEGGTEFGLRLAAISYSASALSFSSQLVSLISDFSICQPSASPALPPSCPALPALPVRFLRDLILLELLVQVAARRVDHFGGLRNVPAVLAKLRDQVRALGVVLELAERAGLRRRAAVGAPGFAAAGRPARARRPGRSATSMVSPAVMMISRSTVFRSSRMLPFQR